MVLPVIEIGSHIWVGDPEQTWLEGIVLNIKGEEAEIETNDGKTIVANLSKVYPRDAESPEDGVDDMTKLLYLHEPSVLHNLSRRYGINEIYTYTGNILIAVNPFKGLPELYDVEVMEKYKGATIGKLSPHVFAIADIAYRAMIDEGKSNSILVSGESGAGKTETTKMLMRYLAHLGGNNASEGRSVEQQVLESNPVLEAFGNAKTVRNNNSSRFGKFVEIQFNEHGRISGAAIRTYLLERSRVCQISDPERNYHCFYLLCAAPQEEIEKYKLGNPSSFHYLNQSNCYDLVGVNDAREYLTTRRAMDTVGISKEDQEAIFRVVAAILHLGNINFAKEEEADSSALKDESSQFHLQMTAELLMCDPHSLEGAICQRIMITPEEIIKKSLNPHDAAVNRDGLAKTIYSRLFEWLVAKINVSIGQDPNSKCLIGVLDIYGFESFKTNSFEQFCINFTNEKLQQHFNQHVFKMDQQEYVKEEIDWSYIEFIDNQDILDLIEKKTGGIIALLDEACMFPKSTHETFAQKLYQTFKDHKRFIKPKLTRADFTIVHYAGEVQYQSDLFLDKNKDYVVPEHRELLSASRCSFVSGLFRSPTEENAKPSKFSAIGSRLENAKPSKFSSIGSRFKLQLQKLMDTLNSTQPHYIRCVKPNNTLEPGVFDGTSVMQQLRSGGVLEAIRIKCSGYPTHMTFSEFLQRFGMLAPEILRGDYEERVACKWIFEKMELTGHQLGKTKVFLRSGQGAELDAHRARVLRNSAAVIQRHAKARSDRKSFTLQRQASVHIQSQWRGKRARKLYKEKREDAAAVKIQRNLRRQLATKSYNGIRSSAVTLQSGLRAMAARSEFRSREQNKAATALQAYWRSHKAVSDYKKLKETSVVSQCSMSERIAEEETMNLNMEEEETDDVELSYDELREKVEELKFHLLSEKQLRIELEVEKGREIITLLQSLKNLQNQVDETNDVLLREREDAYKGSGGDDASNPDDDDDDDASNPDDDAKKETHSEVQNLKALLRAEKQRADHCEKKYVEAQELSEKRRKKLRETEKRVRQLQDSLNRMLYSISDQFADLKMILHTSSPSASTSGTVATDVRVDVASDLSDAASTDSDFSFRAPVLSAASEEVPPQNNGFQLRVQDLSTTENSGAEEWHGDKEGAFDDYF